MSWQNYSVCVQHFCLYSLRFYWGAKKGYLILHSYWKHLLKGKKKTYFLFLTKLYSTCNSPLHPQMRRWNCNRYFPKKGRRALRILIYHCSKKYANNLAEFWREWNDSAVFRLLSWETSLVFLFLFLQSGQGRISWAGALARCPDTFLLKSHLADEILWSLVKDLSRMLDCWAW